MAKASSSDSQKKTPKVVIWLESSITSLHTMHMAMMSRALQAKGFDVSIITSEDTLKFFEKSGGKLTKKGYCDPDSSIDFGSRAHFLTPLASQESYAKPGMPQNDDHTLRPFNFIGSHPIAEKRSKVIAKLIEQERPDALLTSLWPGGYGVFSPEIEDMIGKAKKLNPNCKVYSLSNDIPYIDWHWNDPYEKVEKFKLVDKTFVRGDGSIPLNYSIPLEREQKRKVHYIGHFVTPLPARTQIPDKDRKVLVTYGTRESRKQRLNYLLYFSKILDAAPLTQLHDHPWDLVVSPRCSAEDFKKIKQKADDIASAEHMSIKVRRGVFNQKFRQDIADAAFRISQFDIFVLDDVSTGIPALITTGEMGELACGRLEGEDRLENLARIGAPVATCAQYYLKYPHHIVELVNSACEQSKRKPFSLPLDAAEKAADMMARDFKLEKDHSIPEPVLTVTSKVTSQVDAHERGTRRV